MRTVERFARTEQCRPPKPAPFFASRDAKPFQPETSCENVRSLRVLRSRLGRYGFFEGLLRHEAAKAQRRRAKIHQSRQSLIRPQAMKSRSRRRRGILGFIRGRHVTASIAWRLARYVRAIAALPYPTERIRRDRLILFGKANGLNELATGLSVPGWRSGRDSNCGKRPE